MVALAISSCRTDHFHEKETYNNSSKFQLTSKRVSLSEAKHKEKLFTELDKAEANFKAFSKNVNGVCIDTDDVIYIENGSNYHTYTFNIIRENAPADAPVENLVLSPLPDGSYKELLITYNFTPHEKQKIMDGETVDTRGKTTITDIAKGAFAQVLKSGLQSCSWEDKAVWEGCSQKKSNGASVHNETNVGSWGDCTTDTPPRMYTVAVFICTSIYDDNGPGGGSTPANPSDGGTGGGNPCPECPTAGNTPTIRPTV